MRKNFVDVLRSSDVVVFGSESRTWSSSELPNTNRPQPSLLVHVVVDARLIVVIDRRDDALAAVVSAWARRGRGSRRCTSDDRRSRRRGSIVIRRADVAARVEKVDLRRAVNAVARGRPRLVARRCRRGKRPKRPGKPPGYSDSDSSISTLKIDGPPRKVEQRRHPRDHRRRCRCRRDCCRE